MRSIRNILISVALVGLLFFACESPNDNDEPNTVTLQGKVVDTQSGNPISNAVVRVINISPEITELTNAQGDFSIEFELEDSRTVQVIASKESYKSDTTEVIAVPDRTVDLPLLRLTPTDQTPVMSGNAASIVLMDQSTDHIGVRESGSNETARLTFQVQDSTGTPLDLDHAVEVRFGIGSGPGGGEFIFPPSQVTDDRGQAVVHVTSGTRAGVVQVIAEATVDTGIIRSKPIAIAIHGGLPNASHFSIAVEKVNFPGYNIYGLTNQMTAFVGDKYSNPVRPGTVVWFSTDGGIIEGSALTNLQGQASVSLISAAPKPNHPQLGPGFATVTATTIDENQDQIFADAIVLFSGVPTISIQPTSFNIPNLGSQAFVYIVSDQNNNPLAEGTSINVTVEGDDVEALGALDATLPDTQSPAWTTFSFIVFDTDSSMTSRPVSIEISTSGPNGGAFLSIGGTAQ